jgi:alpha-N-arabinofuranosidase
MRKSCLLLCYAASIAALAAEPTLTVDVAHPSGKVSPRLYGLMTEEINHCYDGGLYAKLIRNRAFLDDEDRPVHWSVVSGCGADATFSLDPVNPYTTSSPPACA